MKPIKMKQRDTEEANEMTNKIIQANRSAEKHEAKDWKSTILYNNYDIESGKRR